MCLIFSYLNCDACYIFQQAYMPILLKISGLSATLLFLLQRFGGIRPGSAERLPQDGSEGDEERDGNGCDIYPP